MRDHAHSLSERISRYVDRSGGPDACWPWTRSRTDDGYGKVSLGKSGTMGRAHRVAYELAVGPIPDGLVVCHRCDSPSCCNPAHLFVGTVTENNHDRDAKGHHGSHTRPERRARGEKNARAKLTAESVRAIREQARSGKLQREIAAEFGVSQQAIGRVLSGRRWGHVT